MTVKETKQKFYLNKTYATILQEIAKSIGQKESTTLKALVSMFARNAKKNEAQTRRLVLTVSQDGETEVTIGQPTGIDGLRALMKSKTAPKNPQPTDWWQLAEYHLQNKEWRYRETLFGKRPEL